MKINNDATALQQNYYLNNAQQSYDKALGNIATIRAISGVDGANLAIADSLRTQASTIDQGIANAYDAIGVLQIADASLTGIAETTDRLSELSVQMNNAVLNDSQKSMLQTEANRLQQSIEDSFNNATYNGKNVFQTMNFVVGSGVESTSLNSIDSSGLDISNQESIESFVKQLSSLRSEIGAGINAITSNINASVQNSLSAKSSEANLLNDDLGVNTTELNTAYLKENSAAFMMAQSNLNLETKLSALIGD
ncbi:MULTISPECIES: flagellin [unclassified Campylobacter]|uniref:flagellin n=1 Tax=unclassified Campylobacter TaxID=2593542 RepID=UPI00123814F8|nr:MULTISPECIES: flagellin [unclassified Campylobacter]KAA6226333.1 flagellin [Campylobacter sp. LR286c]KAA6226825.1 flagellin [Campylobacter sp. LR196d]